ncbi:MAG: hypothetical protein AVDCRST_MAG75-2976, partial [uncultured Propionibacteriaceae bacterium]
GHAGAQPRPRIPRPGWLGSGAGKLGAPADPGVGMHHHAHLRAGRQGPACIERSTSEPLLRLPQPTRPIGCLL